ncbi:MAG: hypothetical protein JW786_04095 [Desulfobacterales bacterium]|nr:hypothetical protein [Desulfobacterales bacterium]
MQKVFKKLIEELQQKESSVRLKNFQAEFKKLITYEIEGVFRQLHFINHKQRCTAMIKKEIEDAFENFVPIHACRI